MRSCKNKQCKKKFEPVGSTLQPVCSVDCSIEYSKQLREKKEKKEGKTRRRKIKVLKESLKTLSDHKKELQVLVNRYVRIRDTGKQCISCIRMLRESHGKGGLIDAGHFWSQGGNPSVRFDLDNIHAQCVYCNRDKHGNLLDYREGLIFRIGQERYDSLAKRRTEENKQTIPEIQKLKELFKQKIKLS